MDEPSSTNTDERASTKSRRLLLISHPFPPRVQPGGFRSLRFLRYLPKMGWDTQVLTMKHTSAGRPIPIDEKLLQMVPHSTHVEQTGAWRPYSYLVQAIKRRRSSPTASQDSHSGTASVHNSSRWKQRFDHLRNLILATPDSEIGWIFPAISRGLTMIRRFRPHVMMVTTPPHSAQLVGYFLKQLTGIPLVLDFRDPWSRAPWQSSDSWARRFTNRTLESLCVHSANHILLNTTQLRDDFRAYYSRIPGPRFTTLMNGYDPDLKDVIDGLTATCRENNIDRTWRLVHAGGLYGQRNPDGLFAAIRTLNDEGISVSFEHYGTIPDESLVYDSIRRHQVESFVTLSRPLPHRTMLERLALSDGILILQPDTHLQVPSKLFESMLFNKPLLGLCGPGATREIMETYGLGAVAMANNPGEIKCAIRSLIEAPSNMPAESRRQADALHDFHARSLTQQLHEALSRLLPSHPPQSNLPHSLVHRPQASASEADQNGNRHVRR
ncbi:MAG: glycosyltransferase [Planctomycetota bacterium]|nr:glycosyltransferase [Planctomycetota bacterium]MDA1179291.1 glycosyltransferase [Planctomycetota bacterium]